MAVKFYMWDDKIREYILLRETEDTPKDNFVPMFRFEYDGSYYVVVNVFEDSVYLVGAEELIFASQGVVAVEQDYVH